MELDGSGQGFDSCEVFMRQSTSFEKTHDGRRPLTDSIIKLKLPIDNTCTTSTIGSTLCQVCCPICTGWTTTLGLCHPPFFGANPATGQRSADLPHVFEVSVLPCFVELTDFVQSPLFLISSAQFV